MELIEATDRHVVLMVYSETHASPAVSGEISAVEARIAKLLGELVPTAMNEARERLREARVQDDDEVETEDEGDAGRAVGRPGVVTRRGGGGDDDDDDDDE